MSADVQAKIQELVSSAPVVLFMKGNRLFPRCGFSATAVEILKRCGVTDMPTIDVLHDQDIRQGIKQFSNWPTIPQLYVGGKLVGGSDIMREMYESGELQSLLDGLAKPAD